MQNALGQFTPRPQAVVDEPPSIAGGLALVIARLFIGIPIWFVIAILTLLSAVPYGGGSQGMFAFAGFAAVFIVLWACIPVLEALQYVVKQRLSARSSSPGTKKRDA
ncbi:MAG: hypothetical protein KIT60_12065 [Burkholderiaceae bacterium]|nr:hypothetical protein [Burkholderiaceae bacterium]